MISGYGFYDKHINNNLINAIQLISKKLLINPFREASFRNGFVEKKISDLLEIDLENITVKNLTAKTFY
jgi:hypothetical protein